MAAATRRREVTDPAGLADAVLYVPTADLLGEQIGEVGESRQYKIPLKRRRPKGSFDPTTLEMYQGNEGLLVKTVLVRSNKYLSLDMLPVVGSPADAAALCQHVGYYDQEHLVVICLDGRSNVHAIYEAAIGGTDRTMVEIRHAIKVPLLTGAVAFIIVHNHPSGSIEPSRQDIDLTEQIRTSLTCAHVGLVLADHIIVSHGRYLSFVEKGIMPSSEAEATADRLR